MNVIESDIKNTKKIKDMLHIYNRLAYDYQSKIGYDTLIQKVIFKEIINIVVATIVDIDTALKMKIKRTKYLESRLLLFINFYCSINDCCLFNKIKY